MVIGILKNSFPTNIKFKNQTYAGRLEKIADLTQMLTQNDKQPKSPVSLILIFPESEQTSRKCVKTLWERMCESLIGKTYSSNQQYMYLTNGNPYLDFAVPNGENIIPVDGFTMNPKTEKNKKKEKLPEEYNKIMNQRKYTVLISFGSVIRSYQMPDHFKSGVVEAMKNLPEITFIWKYEKDDDSEFNNTLPSNVHLKKWVPQPAILADPRLSLFVTHGGLASTMKVAYSGIAASMIPIFGDQPYNAMMLARHGGAIACDRFDLANCEKTDKNYQRND